MRRFILSLLSSLVIALAAYPQGASDPNEGTRLIPLGSDDCEFTWWARAGVHYLVDVSDDLMTWTTSCAPLAAST